MATFEQTNLQAFLNRLNSNTLTASDQAILAQSLAFVILNWGNTGISVDPNVGTGTDPAAVDDMWFAVLYNEALGIAGGGGLTPASWSVPAWFIDPSGANGGNDANSGQAIGAPLKTWARLQALWGTNAPVLAQNTAITFLSSHVDNTDPVTFKPYVAKGAVVSIQGAAPTVVTAGVVLAGTTAKSRAAGANSLLITTLGGTGAVGQLVQNTTAGKTSRAWAYKSLGAGSFSLTQPLVPMVVPVVSTSPAEVDTWANADTVNLLTPIAVNIAQVEPRFIDSNAAQTNQVVIFQLQVFDPQGQGKDPCNLGQGVILADVFMNRFVVGLADSAVINPLVSVHTNVFNAGGALLVGSVIHNGGCYTATVPLPVVQIGGNCVWDGDFIFGKATSMQGSVGNIGVAFLDNNLTAQCPEVFFGTLAYGTAFLYGSALGNLFIQGTSRFANISGATFTARWTAPNLITGATISNVTTASSHSNANNPDVVNSAITTTVAHLDAAQGVAGFGGLAFSLGGGSISSAV